MHVTQFRLHRPIWFVSICMNETAKERNVHGTKRPKFVFVLGTKKSSHHNWCEVGTNYSGLEISVGEIALIRVVIPEWLTTSIVSI